MENTKTIKTARELAKMQESIRRLQDQKLDKNTMAMGNSAGLVRVRYDEVTGTLYIRNDEENA